MRDPGPPDAQFGDSLALNGAIGVATLLENNPFLAGNPSGRDA
jgi:hypothetical protein